MDELESNSAPAVACQRCGRVDSSLRVSEFSQVTSAVVVAITRAEAGIYCARCRRERAEELNRHSGTFGWLGPKSALKTLDSIASNTDGGQQDPDANAQLLKVVAHQLIECGDREEAIAALQESLLLRLDDEALELLDSLGGVDSAFEQRLAWQRAFEAGEVHPGMSPPPPLRPRVPVPTCTGSRRKPHPPTETLPVEDPFEPTFRCPVCGREQRGSAE